MDFSASPARDPFVHERNRWLLELRAAVGGQSWPVENQSEGNVMAMNDTIKKLRKEMGLTQEALA